MWTVDARILKVGTMSSPRSEGALRSWGLAQPAQPRHQHKQDDVEQALSDASVDAAPELMHPKSGPTSRETVATLVAGGVSGAVAKTLVAPLARLTILYQVHALGAQNPGVLTALRIVTKEEGWRSLFKGNLATIIHRVPYSAVNFWCFEITKNQLEPRMENDVLRRLAAGAVAGIVACTAVSNRCLGRCNGHTQRPPMPPLPRTNCWLVLHTCMCMCLNPQL